MLRFICLLLGSLWVASVTGIAHRRFELVRRGPDDVKKQEEEKQQPTNDDVCKACCKEFPKDDQLHSDCVTRCRARGESCHIGSEKATPCETTRDAHELELDFKDVDGDQDGHFNEIDFLRVTDVMCLPRQVAKGLFDAVDQNHDGFVTTEEWDAGGEDSQVEYATDKVFDAATQKQGDEAPKSYYEVQLPPFDHVDTNHDQYIDEIELFGGIMGEFMNAHGKRLTYEKRRKLANLVEKGFDKCIMPKLDKDEDGYISRFEYDDLKVDSDAGDEVVENSPASRREGGWHCMQKVMDEANG